MNNGFSSPSSDESHGGPPPRVHEEGRQNYERNNRSSDWFAHSNEIIEVKSPTQLKFEAVRANAVKSRESAQEDLNGHSNESSARNAQESPDVVTGQHVNNVVESYANLEISDKPAAKQVKSAEAEDHSNREQNSYSVSVNHSSTVPAPDSEQPPPPPRLELGGVKNAEKVKREPVVRSAGNTTPKESKQGRLHQESSGRGWDQTPPHHRLRADGEGIARKNTADSITEIILQNVNTPPKTKATTNSKNVTENYTPRKPPTPRVHLEGLQNLKKAMNHTEMSAIMHGSPVESRPPRPSSGMKILPHLQRSELW